MDKRRQKKTKRAAATYRSWASACPNCGQRGKHFVPPSFGENGFYTCHRSPEMTDKTSGGDADVAVFKFTVPWGTFVCETGHWLPSYGLTISPVDQWIANNRNGYRCDLVGGFAKDVAHERDALTRRVAELEARLDKLNRAARLAGYFRDGPQHNGERILSESVIDAIVMTCAPPIHPDYSDDDFHEFAQAIEEHVIDKLAAMQATSAGGG